MPVLDPRVDAYIAKSAEFAQPILAHLRALVHEACPEVEETVKWGMPHFMYKGMLCNMAAFKQHCSFGFWKAGMLLSQADAKTETAMGQFGRIASLKDLPSKKTLAGYIKKAMQLNEDGVKAPAKAAKPELQVQDDFRRALEAQADALAHFDAFSTSKKRDYVEWLDEAKTEATRQRRLQQAVEWIAEGKSRNWKYEKG